nr:aspartate/glutamate/uridylate kinase [Tanacetum cinerariifolium]
MIKQMELRVFSHGSGVRRVQAFTFYGFAFTLSSCGRTNGLACCVTGSETSNSNDTCVVKPCIECLESTLPVKLIDPEFTSLEIKQYITDEGGCRDGKGWDSKEVDRRLNYNAHLDLNNEIINPCKDALAGTESECIDPKVAMLIAREVSVSCHNSVEVSIIVDGRNMFYGETWEEATDLDRKKYVMYSGSGATEVEGCGHQIDFLSELRRAMNH